MQKKVIATLITIAAGISIAVAQTPSARAADPEKQVAELNLAWAQAISKGDAAALALLFDDDMIVTSGNGTIRNKPSEIKDAAGGTERIRLDTTIRYRGRTG